MSKTIARTVRMQQNQLLVNIPFDVKRHMKIKPGDLIGFELAEGGFVVITKLALPDVSRAIGRKV